MKLRQDRAGRADLDVEAVDSVDVHGARRLVGGVPVQLCVGTRKTSRPRRGRVGHAGLAGGAGAYGAIRPGDEDFQIV